VAYAARGDKNIFATLLEVKIGAKERKKQKKNICCCYFCYFSK